MQSQAEWLGHEQLVGGAGEQRSAAVGDFLDLCHDTAQDDGRWHLDPSLWIHGTARFRGHSTAVADPSLGVPMLCISRESGQSVFFERVFVSKDMQQHVTEAWPAVGLPVKAPLSVDSRSSGAKDLQQPVARSAPAPSLMVAGHDYLEHSILKSQAGKALALPPQQAYHLARNKLLNPGSACPATSACSNQKRGQLHHRKRTSTAPASFTATAATRGFTAPLKEDGIGQDTGQLIPTSAQQLQQTCEVIHTKATAYECEEYIKADGASLCGGRYGTVCYSQPQVNDGMQVVPVPEARCEDSNRQHRPAKRAAVRNRRRRLHLCNNTEASILDYCAPSVDVDGEISSFRVLELALTSKQLDRSLLLTTKKQRSRAGK